MRPFPPSAALPSFVGDEITQVCLNPHGVHFAFESGVLLAAEFRIEQSGPSGDTVVYDCVAADGPPLLLHRLLYRPTTAIQRTDLSLTFFFDGGQSLKVLADVGPYESGSISGEGYPFTVF